MKTLILVFFFSLVTFACFAQANRKADSLNNIYYSARTEMEKVEALNAIVDYYYQNQLYKQGDSVLGIQLHVAELSNNNVLILKTYFNDNIANIFNWSTREDFERTITFIQHGIDFARSINEYDYIAIGQTRLAKIFRKRGDTQKAVENATSALINLQNIKSDSIKAVVYIELGDSYHAKGESIEACKSYNIAFDIAVKINNRFLQSNVYHRLSEIYYTLGDITEAKNTLIESVNLNRKAGEGESLIKDYTELARVTDDTFYVRMALSLSDSLHVDTYKFRAKSILLAIYMTVQKNSAKALQYMESQPELKEYYMQGGIANYQFQLGEIYRYANQPDSALRYFEMAEPGLLRNFDPAIAKYVYLEMATCYEMKKDRQKAIDYYLKTLAYCDNAADLSNRASISNSLSELYHQTGNFESALDYKIIATSTRDSVLKLSKDRDIALLGVDREARKHKEELRQEEVRVENERNIQYMAISIAICVIFVCLLIIGMFPVSKMVIKILGYIFFICLFEFIVLVLDNTILHHATHGEPLKLWGIKIFLIACLVPIQHYLEHRLIKFLESRKLLRARTKLAAKKWLKIKRTPPASETAVDTDMIRQQELILEAEMLRQQEEQRLSMAQRGKGEEKEIDIEGDAGVL